MIVQNNNKSLEMRFNFIRRNEIISHRKQNFTPIQFFGLIEAENRPSHFLNFCKQNVKRKRQQCKFFWLRLFWETKN